MDGLNTIITLQFDPNPTRALLVAPDREAIIIRNLSVARQSRTTPTQRHSQTEFEQSIFILIEFVRIPAENIKEIKPTWGPMGPLDPRV